MRGTPVRSGKAVVNRSGAKKAHVYQCVGCHAHHFQPIARVVKGDKVVAGAGPPVGMTCAHCGRPMNVGGPLWTAPLQDVDFVDALSARLSSDEGADFASRRRLAGLLANVGEELPDVPLFTHLPTLCSTLKLNTPPLVAVFSALVKQGYRVSRSHTDPMAIKTDAPYDALYDVLRCWATNTSLNGAQAKKAQDADDTPGAAILAVPPKTQADFSPHPDVEKMLSKDLNGPRFMPNPARWGPGTKGRAKIHVADSDAPTRPSG